MVRGLMTLQEAARSLGLSVNTLYTQVRAGKLRAERLGARVLVVTAAEVERYRAESKGQKKGGPKPKDKKR